ncbi:MAG TPA: homoserine dehydrogenase, partial [Flavisolibacter sp.]|nr:homoserine dehydrogenase [Flavisolibacter sp.]
EEINVIVELINDADEAYKIVTTALRQKKAVVSANKKLIAEHLQELLHLQKEYETSFLYEAAVCGSIPILRNLEEYYDNDLLQSVCGIVNGSTNFILTKIFEEKLSYKQALLLAQQAGFAEADPTLDVEGIDAVNKLTILLAHAYGAVSAPGEIIHRGISQINAYDAAYAAEKGFRIKLTAQAKKLSNGKIAAFVLPQFVTAESQLYNVKNEYNGVVLESSFADKQFLYGKGAGRYPTSSAVLSDLSALRYQYKYEYRKLHAEQQNELTDDYYLRLFVSFDKEGDIDKSDFEWIEEAYQNEKRQYVIGAVHVQRLKRASWLSHQNVSAIICPNGIIENLELRKVKKRSLELAGVPRTVDGFVLN